MLLKYREVLLKIGELTKNNCDKLVQTGYNKFMEK